MEETFYYFGFGSNLLKERIHISNPSAIFVSIAKLKDYKLDFGYDNDWWRGSAATVVESPGDHVWGVLWQLNIEHLETLDKQEEVSTNVYRPLEVAVVTENGRKFKARTYQLVGNFDHEDKMPSPHYLQVILSGAEENHFPQEYIDKLKNIKHNGNKKDVHVYSLLKTVPKQPTFL